MMKPKVYSTYGQIFNFDLNQPLDIFIDMLPDENFFSESKKIFIAMEPDSISKISRKLIEKQNKFDYIFTFNEVILENCKNSILFEFGTKWVDIENYNFPQKKFSISTVCGHKELTKNHFLRKKIWYNQDKIKKPKDFYLSSKGGVENINNNKILYESKIPMFNSMFHICVKNVSEKYYFSEKLIDCILCKTVPVYVGCKNIDDYFDIRGIIIPKDFNDLIEKCNSLTEEDYFCRINFIEENFEKSKKWIDYEKRLEEKIKNIIN